MEWHKLDKCVSIPKWCDYRDVAAVALDDLNKFQFQNGAIIGDNVNHLQLTVTLFQFQNGAIIGFLLYLKCILIIRFNSKMVRL